MLGVVVLAEHSDVFSLEDPAEVHGVDRLVRLADVSLEAAPTVEDEVEVGENF